MTVFRHCGLKHDNNNNNKKKLRLGTTCSAAHVWLTSGRSGHDNPRAGPVPSSCLGLQKKFEEKISTKKVAPMVKGLRCSPPIQSLRLGGLGLDCDPGSNPGRRIFFPCYMRGAL